MRRTKLRFFEVACLKRHITIGWSGPLKNAAAQPQIVSQHHAGVESRSFSTSPAETVVIDRRMRFRSHLIAVSSLRTFVFGAIGSSVAA
jgi:hypothetical protein